LKVELEVKDFGNFDVVIIGGGSAGAIAAVACSRMGVKTLLIERFNCFGGMVTAGLLGSFGTWNDHQELVVGGIPIEFLEKLRSSGVTVGDPVRDDFVHYDIEVAKKVYDEMICEAGCEFLLNSFVCDVEVDRGLITGVVFATVDGLAFARGKFFIDCSGDALVATLAGCPVVVGREKDGKIMPASMMLKIGGVNIERLHKLYQEEHPEWVGDVFANRSYQGFMKVGVEEELEEAASRGLLSPLAEETRHWFVGMASTPREGEIMLNVHGAVEKNLLEPWERSRSEVEARARAWAIAECLKNFVPGFENSYVSCSAPLLGIRETRKIVGEYVLTAEDILSGRKFDDGIAFGSCYLAVHDPEGREISKDSLPKGHKYHIPFRSLIPRGMENLLVAGRCISVTHEALGSTRIVPTCMAEGQAAGVAAALAVKEGVSNIRKLNVDKLKESIKKVGGRL